MEMITYITALYDKKEAIRLKNTLYTSLGELKGTLANDGVDYHFILPIDSFMEDWHNTYNDYVAFLENLKHYYITYIQIISG